ncbi:MAG: hypothetical protein ACLFUM_05965 [Spirochaetaceae bacterium]
MELTCLSINNPVSYLICYGIKEVENRSWTTDYRGTLGIHSAGRVGFRGMPDFSRFPMPVIHEFDRFLSEIYRMDETGTYIGIPDEGVRVVLKDEEHQPQNVLNQYRLLSDVYAHYRSNDESPFFHANAIIGTVELVDIVTDSQSPWAEPEKFHWVLSNPRLFATPITDVREKAGLWVHKVDDE